MSVLMVLAWKDTPFESYERVSELTGIRGDEDAPEGLIEHVVTEGDDGLVIFDVWESEEALGKFVAGLLRPALEQAGIDETQPRVMPVHNRLRGKSNDANVVVLVEAPGLDKETYDRMTQQMDAHVRNEHPSVTHTAAVGDGGAMFIVDIWDLPESFAAFADEQIAPAAADAGLGGFEPRILAIKNRIRGKAMISR